MRVIRHTGLSDRVQADPVLQRLTVVAIDASGDDARRGSSHVSPLLSCRFVWSLFGSLVATVSGAVSWVVVDAVRSPLILGDVSGSTNQLAVRIGPTGRMGSLAGLVAGPFFLVSVGLNTWASLDYLQSLGWQFVGGEQVPWPSSLARGPFAWAQIATFALHGFPRHRLRAFLAGSAAT